VSILRVLDTLDLGRLRGTLVAVMLANPTAFRGYGRNTPIDGANLNRIFPGSASGYHSEQVAHTLLETALATADVLLDLHSGGDRSVVPFYALYWDDGSEASRESGRLARGAGTPNIWASTDTWLTGTMFTHFVQRGKPALIVECGGGAQLPEEHVANFAMAIRGVMQGLSMLEGDPPRQPRYVIMEESYLVYSHRGGLFLPLVEPGQIVARDQELGTIFDLYGTAVETVRSPVGPALVASIRRRYMPVYSGDQIAECNTIVNETVS
jgi:predicted deacylase